MTQAVRLNFFFIITKWFELNYSSKQQSNQILLVKCYYSLLLYIVQHSVQSKKLKYLLSIIQEKSFIKLFAIVLQQKH